MKHAVSLWFSLAPSFRCNTKTRLYWLTQKVEPSTTRLKAKSCMEDKQIAKFSLLVEQQLPCSAGSVSLTSHDYKGQGPSLSYICQVDAMVSRPTPIPKLFFLGIVLQVQMSTTFSLGFINIYPLEKRTMKMSLRTLLGIGATGTLVPSYQPLQTKLRPLKHVDYILYKTVFCVFWCSRFWLWLQPPSETTKYLTQ